MKIWLLPGYFPTLGPSTRASVLLLVTATLPAAAVWRTTQTSPSMAKGRGQWWQTCATHDASILSNFRIFDPRNYVGITTAQELKDFGKESFEVLLKHFCAKKAPQKLFEIPDPRTYSAVMAEFLASSHSKKSCGL